MSHILFHSIGLIHATFHAKNKAFSLMIFLGSFQNNGTNGFFLKRYINNIWQILKRIFPDTHYNL